jgi:ribonuclease Z
VNSGDELSFDGYTIRALKARHTIPSFSYCLEEQNRPGKFNKSKALELGIPEGPLFSKLQKGHIITLSDGRKISPDLVLGPARKGRKIVVSGDTVPFEEMVAFARYADVLVHEATFDSELQDLSREYGHTTAFQAAEIAKEAQVEKLCLTHISPRYLDHRVLENDARKVFPHSFVPKDFQEVDIKLKK